MKPAWDGNSLPGSAPSAKRQYTVLGYRPGDFPVAESCAAEILSLPMFPGLTAEQQKRVANAVQASVTVRFHWRLALAAASAGD